MVLLLHLPETAEPIRLLQVGAVAEPILLQQIGAVIGRIQHRPAEVAAIVELTLRPPEAAQALPGVVLLHPEAVRAVRQEAEEAVGEAEVVDAVDFRNNSDSL